MKPDQHDQDDRMNISISYERWKQVGLSIIRQRQLQRDRSQLAETIQARYEAKRQKAGEKQNLQRFQDITWNREDAVHRINRDKSLNYFLTQFPEKAAFPPDTQTRSQTQSIHSAIMQTRLKSGNQDSGEESDPEQHKLRSTLERSTYSVLDPQLKNFLSTILNIRIPSVKIYANQTADTFAKRLNADAITYQDKILLRSGRSNLTHWENLALLGHELTHVARSGNSDQSPIHTKDEAEEREALSNELKVRQHFLSSSSPQGYVNSPIGHAVAPQAPAHIHTPPKPQPQAPKTALSSRDLRPTSESSSASVQISAMQLSWIKEEIYRDIIRRIKTDFERGG